MKKLTSNFVKSKRKLKNTMSYIKAEKRKNQQEGQTIAINERKRIRERSLEAKGFGMKPMDQSHFEFFQELTQRNAVRGMQEKDETEPTQEDEEKMFKLKGYIQ